MLHGTSARLGRVHTSLLRCLCRIREMRQPGAGCNAAAAIVTGVAQFVSVADVTLASCAQQPIDYSYSLGYHVGPCTTSRTSSLSDAPAEVIRV